MSVNHVGGGGGEVGGGGGGTNLDLGFLDGHAVDGDSQLDFGRALALGLAQLLRKAQFADALLDDVDALRLVHVGAAQELTEKKTKKIKRTLQKKTRSFRLDPRSILRPRKKKKNAGWNDSRPIDHRIERKKPINHNFF